MNDATRVTFTGGGVNAPSFKDAIVRPFTDPRQRTVPTIATSPFVKLSIGSGVAEFKLMSVRKTVHSAEVKISLSKFGYLYFRTPDQMNDFGFSTDDIDKLLRELRDHGFQLDESCEQNLRAAKTSMLLINVFAIAALLTGALVVIISAHGL